MTPTEVNQLLQSAVAYHQRGEYERAEAIYRRILAFDADQPDALHLAGLAARHLGRPQEAIELISRAIALRPEIAAVHSNLANVYLALNRIDEAIGSLRRALQLKPDFPEALNNLGSAHRAANRLEEAADAYSRAIAIKPDFAEAQLNFAAVLHLMHRPPEAGLAARIAVGLAPQNPEAHFLLGTILHEQRRLSEALGSYQRALELNPQHADALNHLGLALRDLHRPQEAEQCFRRALAIRADHVGARHNLALLLQTQQRLTEAAGEYTRTLQADPSYALSLKNLGSIRYDEGRFTEAADLATRALQLNPADAEAYNNLALALQSQGRIPESLAAFRQAIILSPDNNDFQSNWLLGLHYDPQLTPHDLLEARARYAIRFPPAPAKNRKSQLATRKCRLAYVSADFRAHPIAYFLEPLLAHHDHERFEVFAYSNSAQFDDVTARLRSHVDHWRDVAALSDDDLVALIRSDDIDLLIDLSVHTSGNRLPALARKPAPIQLSYLGYASTTGLPAIDYRITDSVLDPPDAICIGPEKLLRLPDIFCCYQPDARAPQASELPALRNGFITFGSFNNLAKLNEPLIDIWSRILRSVPNSKLLLKSVGLQDPALQEQFHSFFAAHDISSDRLILQGPSPIEEYFEAFSQIDVALDPFPFNGHTTSCHTLYMGVPLITLAGQIPVSRVGASLLQALGLSDLVAQAPADYIQLARDLVGAIPRLRELRASLRSRMLGSSLTNARAFVPVFEQSLRALCT